MHSWVVKFTRPTSSHVVLVRMDSLPYATLGVFASVPSPRMEERIYQHPKYGTIRVSPTGMMYVVGEIYAHEEFDACIRIVMRACVHKHVSAQISTYIV